ncbi:hypothetical protein CBL_11879 [Carabus blaptoides fortunei]
MFKLIALAFAAILAVAVATPGVLSSAYVAPAVSPYGYGYAGYSPLTYSAGYPYAYNTNGNYYGYAAPYAYRYY